MLWNDIKYAIRTLLKKPGFCLVAIFTFALGIGANTAIFSVVNGVVLKPLPYVEPERIIQLWEYDKRQKPTQSSISPLNFNDWRNQSQQFEHLSAYRFLSFTLTGGSQPESLRGAGVSASFLSVLGVKPALGRDFLAEEDAPGKNRVVMISNGFWRTRFEGRADVLSQTLQLNGETHNIIGVLPAGFEFPNNVELWTPLGIDVSRIERGNHFLFAIGKLNPGVQVSAAQVEMDSIAGNLEQQYPNTNTNSGINLIPLHEQIVNPTVRASLYVLLGAVGLVLLIACANVTNLLLVRATSRRKEIAVRLSIGASRWQLFRQFLTEGLLLSALGGGVGLFLAWWGVDLILSLIPNDVPRFKDINLDSRVLLFTLIASFIAGTISSVIPALYGTRLDLNHTLKESGQSVAGNSLKNGVLGVLVSAEIAIALVVLVGAGLLLTTFLRLQNVNPGFNPTNLLSAQISLPQTRYKEAEKPGAFFQKALERINNISGLESAGAVSNLPFSGSRSVSSFEVEGRPSQNSDDGFAADRRVVTPNYFKTMNIPLVEGRDVTDRDTPQTNGVIVVNQCWARTFFPNENAIGKRIQIGDEDEVELYGKPIWREVVGIVGDIKHQDLAVAEKPEMYIPYLQQSSSRMMLVARGKGDSGNLTAAIRNEVQSLDGDLPLYNIRMMDERLALSLTPQKFIAILISIFAIIALLLAIMGIYGVMAYTVEQNTREIGIRIALGAQSRNVLNMVIQQGLKLAVMGIVLGLGAAYFLAKTLSGLLYSVSATDFTTFGSIAFLLALVTVVACLVPARRATKVDPMIALRYE
ncbi:MAG: ABC transporter permease [Acidobacteriota bacterium]